MANIDRYIQMLAEIEVVVRLQRLHHYTLTSILKMKLSRKLRTRREMKLKKECEEREVIQISERQKLRNAEVNHPCFFRLE